MDSDKYGLEEVLEILDISKAQFQRWKKRLLAINITTGVNQGRKIFYSGQDIVEYQLIKSFTQSGNNIDDYYKVLDAETVGDTSDATSLVHTNTDITEFEHPVSSSLVESRDLDETDQGLMVISEQLENIVSSLQLSNIKEKYETLSYLADKGFEVSTKDIQLLIGRYPSGNRIETNNFVIIKTGRGGKQNKFRVEYKEKTQT